MRKFPIPTEAIHNEAAEMFSKKLNVKKLSKEILEETRARAINKISIMEAWLYRDWQAGIGDLMVKESSVGNRSFEVIGFRTFESLFLEGAEEEKRWINRLNSIIEKLDISGEPKYDARILQLKNTMIATAKMVKSLVSVKSRHHFISNETKNILDRISGDC